MSITLQMNLILKYCSILYMFYFSSVLSRSNSGASTDSITTPLKLIQKDSDTGDYIVRMSPDDFDRLANQGRLKQSNQR